MGTVWGVGEVFVWLGLFVGFWFGGGEGFHIFPCQLGKTYAKEYPRILYFENLQMRVSLLFKGGVGLCK